MECRCVRVNDALCCNTPLFFLFFFCALLAYLCFLFVLVLHFAVSTFLPSPTRQTRTPCATFSPTSWSLTGTFAKRHIRVSPAGGDLSCCVMSCERRRLFKLVMVVCFCLKNQGNGRSERMYGNERTVFEPRKPSCTVVKLVCVKTLTPSYHQVSIQTCRLACIVNPFPPGPRWNLPKGCQGVVAPPGATRFGVCIPPPPPHLPRSVLPELCHREPVLAGPFDFRAGPCERSKYKNEATGAD